MFPNHFAGRVFKGKVQSEPCSVYDFLLFGWWGDNRVMPRNLVLSLKLPSSTWARALVLAEGLKEMACQKYLPWLLPALFGKVPQSHQRLPPRLKS